MLPPLADFTADVTSIIEGETVHFSDLSTNNPTSWNWTFEGGTPGISTLQNPVVVYNLEGVYDVALTVTNAGGSNTITNYDYIAVDHVTVISEPTMNELSIYPNPAKDVLKVQSPDIIENISIINILGSVVLNSAPGDNNCNLDLSDFDVGIYFVMVQTGKGTFTKKVQVQK